MIGELIFSIQTVQDGLHFDPNDLRLICFETCLDIYELKEKLRFSTHTE